jgi:hypothetical protein
MTDVIGGSPYESSNLPSGGPGVTVYDDGFPVVGFPIAKGTDDNVDLNLPPNPYVEWTDLDYTVGGEPGAVNRNAYVVGGMPAPDAHDFRGDHPVIPARVVGAYGDVGNTDDYASDYALGIAANAYPDVTMEESQDEVSAGF